MNRRVIVPLICKIGDEFKTKNEIRELIKEIDSQRDIYGIEINISDLLTSIGSWKEIKQILEEISKPTFGVAALQSKGSKIGIEETIENFSNALKNGFNYICIEHIKGNTGKQIEQIKECLIESGNDIDLKTRLVIEYANFEITPGLNECTTIIEDIRKFDPVIIKFICKVNRIEENEIYLELLKKYSGKLNLIAFGMGNEGIKSRKETPNFGAYGTYGSYTEATCPGQIYYKELA